MSKKMNKILIIAAMPEELNEYLKLLDDFEKCEYQNIEYYKSKIENKQIIVALSGVGKANASTTASALSILYNVDLIINIGSAGGLLEGQKIGDVVIAERCQFHDLDIGSNTHRDSRFIFDMDQGMVHQITKLLQALDITYHSGLLLAGDQFITKDSQQFLKIQDFFSDAIAVDMESAAIASSAHRLNIPFIVLRSLSDVTFQEGNVTSFEEYLQVASKQSAIICHKIVELF